MYKKCDFCKIKKFKVEYSKGHYICPSCKKVINNYNKSIIDNYNKNINNSEEIMKEHQVKKPQLDGYGICMIEIFRKLKNINKELYTQEQLLETLMNNLELSKDFFEELENNDDDYVSSVKFRMKHRNTNHLNNIFSFAKVDKMSIEQVCEYGKEEFVEYHSIHRLQKLEKDNSVKTIDIEIGDLIST